MHACLVRVWSLCGGEKNAQLIVYLLCESSVKHPTSFLEASQKAKLEELSNNLSDRSEAEVRVYYGFNTRRAKRG